MVLNVDKFVDIFRNDFDDDWGGYDGVDNGDGARFNRDLGG